MIQEMNNQAQQTIGSRLRDARKAARYSQYDVARIFGVSQAQVAHHETGHARVNADQLMAYAKLYGCSVLDLYPPEEVA